MLSGLSNVTLNTTCRNIITQKKERFVGFSSEDKPELKNPVRPGFEMAVACTGPVLMTILSTIGAFAVSKKVPLQSIQNKSWLIAGAVGIGSALMSLPAAIYNAKVNSAMKKAQFDSYVPQKTAAPETAPEIKQEVKPEVTDTEKLKTSIDSYFKNKATEKVG